MKLRIWDPVAADSIAVEGDFHWDVPPRWSPDGKYLAAVEAAHNRIRILDRQGRTVSTFSGNEVAVWRIAWGPGLHQITTGGADQTIRVWDALTGNPLWIAACSGGGLSATFDPTGKLLHGDPNTVDDGFRYVLELDDGKLQTLKSSEFRRRFPDDLFGGR